MTVKSEQTVSGIGECRFDVWRDSLVDMLCVFMPDGVADVVTFVLDPPLVSNVIVQFDCCCVFGREAGDDKCVFLSGFLAAEIVGSPSDAGSLFRVRKIDAVNVGDPCFPGVDAAMISFTSSVVGCVSDERNRFGHDGAAKSGLVSFGVHDVVESSGSGDVLGGVALG